MTRKMGLNGWLKAAMAALALLGAAAMGGKAHASEVPASGRIWLEGQSTLHPYKTEATAFDVNLEGGSGSAAQLLESHQLQGATFTVAVVHLRSGESKLDSNLRDALRVRDNPDIVFKASRIDANAVEGASFPVKLTGTLKVAGVEKPEVIEAQGQIQNGVLHLTGAKALKMTDFKVDPPKLMLGTIRCSDEIEIKFDLQLK